MEIESSLPKGNNEDSIAAIFDRIREFHRRQARLPIEEKIRILIELQKIVLTPRPELQSDGRRRRVANILNDLRELG